MRIKKQRSGRPKSSVTMSPEEFQSIQNELAHCQVLVRTSRTYRRKMKQLLGRVDRLIEDKREIALSSEVRRVQAAGGNPSKVRIPLPHELQETGSNFFGKAQANAKSAIRCVASFVRAVGRRAWNSSNPIIGEARNLITFIGVTAIYLVGIPIALAASGLAATSAAGAIAGIRSVAWIGYIGKRIQNARLENKHTEFKKAFDRASRWGEPLPTPSPRLARYVRKSLRTARAETRYEQELLERKSSPIKAKQVIAARYEAWAKLAQFECDEITQRTDNERAAQRQQQRAIQREQSGEPSITNTDQSLKNTLDMTSQPQPTEIDITDGFCQSL